MAAAPYESKGMPGCIWSTDVVHLFGIAILRDMISQTFLLPCLLIAPMVLELKRKRSFMN